MRFVLVAKVSNVDVNMVQDYSVRTTKYARPSTRSTTHIPVSRADSAEACFLSQCSSPKTSMTR